MPFLSNSLVSPKITPFTFGDEPVNYGETVSVSCILLGGDLPVDILWYLNGELLYDNLEGLILKKLGKRVYNLIIESVSGKHIGNYTCSIRNTAGTVQYSAELNVNGLLL